MSRYAESLRYLYGLQRFGIKLGLENIGQLLERLSHPELAFPVVHVAGTNGKGSVCATLTSLLTAAGLRCGLYTSPHLMHFSERIRIGNHCIPESEIVRLTEALRLSAEGIPATFFEFTTAMALNYFREQSIDVAVVETGMGGRLDATNAVAPALTVISSIARDHAAHLGESLAEIAAEKGGIVKEGIPLILARQEPEALDVLLALAAEKSAPVFLEGRDFSLTPEGGALCFRFGTLKIDGLALRLPGRHQVQNTSLALAAWACLRRKGFELTEETIPEGLAAVHWPGRLQWCGPNSRVLLDGAHNAAGARELAAYLRSLGSRRIHWIAGFKADKDIPAMFDALLPRVDSLTLVPAPVEESFPPRQAAELAAERCPVRIGESFEAAFGKALREGGADEVLLVAGSLFLVAEALGCLKASGEL